MSILNTIKTGVASLVRPNTPVSKRKVYLSSGHSNKSGKDMGARYSDFTNSGIVIWEGEQTALLRNRIYKILGDAGFYDQVVIDADANITAETIKLWSSKVTKNDLALDIHFNAAGPDATGVEVIVPDSSSPVENDMAKRFANVSHIVLGSKLRGNAGVITEAQSARGKLGWMRLNCETLLWEVCFLSNKGEQLAFQTKIYDVAAEAAEILISWLKEEI